MISTPDPTIHKYRTLIKTLDLIITPVNYVKKNWEKKEDK